MRLGFRPRMQLDVAIVGAGLMGYWHAHAVKKLGANITAVVDPDPNAAGKVAARFGGRVFSGLEQALKQADVDVVHICTPLSTHVTLARQALEAKKHLIVEKPVAPTHALTAKLYALAATQNCLLCPVHQFAFQTGIIQARKELSLRTHGPLAVTFDFASAGGEGRQDNELNKILIEILPHPLSILSEIWPEALLASGSWCVDSCRAGELFAYSQHQDFPVSIKLSLNARPTHCNMTIYHEQGAIHLNLFHGFVVFESSKVSRLSKIKSPFVLSLKTLYAATRNLTRRLLESEPAYPGLRTLIYKCYDAIEKSAQGPVSGDNTIAVAAVCEQFERKLTP